MSVDLGAEAIHQKAAAVADQRAAAVALVVRRNGVPMRQLGQPAGCAAPTAHAPAEGELAKIRVCIQSPDSRCSPTGTGAVAQGGDRAVLAAVMGLPEGGQTN